jgi:small-conductance mechanosensitive channel
VSAVSVKVVGDRADVPLMSMELAATAAIVAAAGGVRFAISRLVQHGRWRDVDVGRRAIVLARNLTLLLALAALTLVWSDQLRVVGVSMVAFALAMVIAAQDLIRSIMGAVARTTSNAFSVGDLIVVGEQRGYVIDSSVTSTTLLEIGTGHLRTGRTVTIPNSYFLTEPVINETGGHRFILHSFTLPVPIGQWRYASDVLLAAAQLHTADHLEPARVQMEARARRHSLSMPIVEPLVFGSPTDTSTVKLTVRVPVDAQDVWRVEHSIAQAWLEAMASDDNTGSGLAPAPESFHRRRDDRASAPALR